MKRSLKNLVVVGLMLMLSLVMAGAASADTAKGHGWLHARGSGVAILQMTGKVEITSHGVGVVYIHGAEKIEASGQGERVNLPDKRVVIRGYTGKITITGHHMTVKMVGKKIDFKAHGKGRVALRGRGYYETRGGGSGDWMPDGVEVEMVEE